MDPRVALEVAWLAADPEEAERLPGPEPETEVGGEGDRNMEIEDALGDALIGVLGCDEKGEHGSETEQASGGEREAREVIPRRHIQR